MMNNWYQDPWLVAAATAAGTVAIDSLRARFPIRQWVGRGDVDVRGEWTGKYEEDGVSYREVVRVKQRGIHIWGTLEGHELNGESDGDLQYRFTGTLKNSIVSATYEGRSKDNPEQGSFSMQLDKKGRRMSGIYTMVSKKQNSEQFTAVDYEWKRKRR